MSVNGSKFKIIYRVYHLKKSKFSLSRGYETPCIDQINFKRWKSRLPTIFVNNLISEICSLTYHFQFDWTKIQPDAAYVNPLSNVSSSVSPRVVGGREVYPNSKPYQVGLIIDGVQFCGGSLISRTFVLTAGHCIEG